METLMETACCNAWPALLGEILPDIQYKPLNWRHFLKNAQVQSKRKKSYASRLPWREWGCFPFQNSISPLLHCSFVWEMLERNKLLQPSFISQENCCFWWKTPASSELQLLCQEALRWRITSTGHLPELGALVCFSFFFFTMWCCSKVQWNERQEQPIPSGLSWAAREHGHPNKTESLKLKTKRPDQVIYGQWFSTTQTAWPICSQ